MILVPSESIFNNSSVASGLITPYNEELLTYVIDQLATQVTQLVLVTAELSGRIDDIEKEIN